MLAGNEREKLLLSETVRAGCDAGLCLEGIKFSYYAATLTLVLSSLAASAEEDNLHDSYCT